MKVYPKTLLVFIIALATISCDRSISIGIGEEITIPFERKASLYDNGYELTVEFTKLVEESRCQPGLVCFWEGRAVVEIVVNNIETFELEFRTENDDVPVVNSAQYQDYMIELISVFPKSDEDFGIEKKYSIIVEVNRI